MEITLQGRIDEVQQLPGREGPYYNVLLSTPAPDMYSHPNTYKVTSKFSPGAPGQEVALKCQLSSFVKKKPYKDKQTGHDKVFHEANVSINVVEVVALNKPQVAAVAK